MVFSPLESWSARQKGKLPFPARRPSAGDGSVWSLGSLLDCAGYQLAWFSNTSMLLLAATTSARSA
jgi:hypothetical protein